MISKTRRTPAPIAIGTAKERLLLALGERDGGIHDTGFGATFHGHRFNREPIMLLECAEPGNQRVERSCFELHAYAAPASAWLCAAKCTGQSVFLPNAIHEDHRLFPGIAWQHQ